ncbi:Cullin repeat-like-containing domain protein [Amylocystis lapponica]|nr:Cullin repeat-like-containing domain protein [Amylocystis lapponica]
MDDETAEIELLEQNLNKTRHISQRMTAILSSFDSRILKLEKSVLPLYTSTQLLSRRARNIENALLKIDEIASHQDGIAVEEASILRGPQPGRLDEYTELLQRMNATLAFGSVDGAARETARLIETGAKKLIQLYTKLVAEGSSGSPINGPEFTPIPFPSNLLPTLRPLVAFLRTLPLPPTHPSHPAAPAIQSALKDAQKGYGDMRGAWSRKCLDMYGKRVTERAETIDGVAAGRELGALIESITRVAEDEHALLAELAPLPTPPAITSTYAALVAPLAAVFTTTLSALTALIKRSLHKYTFLALSTYAQLTAAQARWDDVMCRRAGRKDSELRDGLQTIRAACQRSFPEILADIKLASMSNRGELSTGLVDITLSTVEYMERIPELQDAVGAILLSLGDGNWKMGEGAQVGKAPRLADVDGRTVLEHFMFDVVNTLLATLLALARMNKRPAFGAIFLLNNVAHLRTRVLLRPRAGPGAGTAALLSKPTQDVLHSHFRTAKAGYFDANFAPLLQTLADDKERAGRAAAKERFTRFFDLLDEVAERHALARVLHDDREGRATLGDEAARLVVPSLQRFVQRHGGRDFSKNPQKYIKMSAEEVEALIKGFYADRDANVPPPAERVTNNLLIQAGWSR